MALIAVVYAVLVWLIFVKLKWLRWGWLTGIATVIAGILVCAIFAGCLNYFAPAGRLTIIGRVIEVTPNVSGEIIEIAVKANQPVKAGAILFKIDSTPYQAQLRQIEAQLKLQETRLAQMKQLQVSSTGRAFDVEDRQANVDQLQAQFDKAKYDLDQTTIHAPADGYVSSLALSKGDRATNSKSVLSFIVADAVQMIGIFGQNGYQAIKPGTRVQFALANNPGHIYTSTISDIVSGVGEGQITSSGTLIKLTSLPMTADYPALIHRPKDLDSLSLRPGMSGTVTAYAPNSAPFDFFGWVLLYGRSLALYL